VANGRPYMLPYRKAQRWVWGVLEHPEQSTLGLIVTIVILVCILMSITFYVIANTPSITKVPATEEEWKTALFIIELVTVVVFTTELVLRFLAYKRKARFFTNFMNMLDILAVLPWYIEIAMSSDDLGATAVLRIIRLARIFRLFKVSRYSTTILVFTKAILKSSNALFALLIYMSMGVVLFSSLLFLCEAGDWDPEQQLYIIYGEPSKFQSLPLCFYWSVTTMTTVGYGDLYPQTDPGRLVACITMICGLIIMSLPMTVIGSNFADEMDRLKEEKEFARLKEMEAEQIQGIEEDLMKDHHANGNGVGGEGGELLTLDPSVAALVPPGT
jgi:hypothetical protein